jgi:hypothetical protein
MKHSISKIKKYKAIPVTNSEYSLVCDTAMPPPPLFLIIGSQMAVRLSALHAGRPHFTPGKIPGTHFC